MSEESAFLAALKANPADDIVRLVYADWLDEHDEHAKAEYLRAVVDLTTHAGGTPRYTDAAVRLFTAVAHTEAVWRIAGGGRFELVLLGYIVTQKVNTIKFIRLLTRLGLAEAKALCESVPISVSSWQPFEVLLPSLLAFPSKVTAEIRPAPWIRGVVPTSRFDILLVKHNIELEPIDDYDPFGDGYVAEIHGLALLHQVSVEEAIARLRTLPLILQSGIHPRAIQDSLRRVKLALNWGDPLPPDAFVIVQRS